MQAKIKTAPEGADGDLSPCVITTASLCICLIVYKVI